MTHEDLRCHAWFDALSRLLGTTQLSHAVAYAERMKRTEAQLKLWRELLEKGDADAVLSEMERFMH